MLQRIIRSNMLKRMGNRMGNCMYSSCQYEQPMLFSPMFSSFFFGAVYTLFINGLCITIYNKQEETNKVVKETRKELQEMRKELQEMRKDLNKSN